MTRTTNAIAGFAYLVYMAVGISNEILMNRATSAEGTAATLARIAEHATDVRVAILLKLLECFSAFVLGVALYGITRDQNRELAMLALVCRVAEGMMIASILVPNNLGLRWLANAQAGVSAPMSPQRMRWAHFCCLPVPSVRSSSPWERRSLPISCCADG